MNKQKRIAKSIVAGLLVLMLSYVLTGCSAGGNGEEGKETETKGQKTDASNVSETETELQTSEESDESNTSALSEGGTRIIVDALGTEVEIPERPQAVAIVNAALPSMVYAVQGTGENIKVIVPSAYKGWENSILKDLAPELAGVNTEVISNDFEVNVEALAANKPDLLICRENDAGQAEQIRAMGIPVAVVNAAKDLDGLKQQITMMGEILNCEERASCIVGWYDKIENRVNEKASEVEALSESERPRVLHIMYAEQLKIYGDGVDPYITDWVGGQNITLAGSSADTSTPTMEEVLVYDPEIIFLSNFDDVTPDDLYNNRLEGQDWSNVSAVKNHKVYKGPCGLYRWAPPNTLEKPLYVLWQASIIQPGIFGDVDMRAEVKSFFQEFFDYELTEEQIDYVLHTDLNQ